jgi:hypothetical protein
MDSAYDIIGAFGGYFHFQTLDGPGVYCSMDAEINGNTYNSREKLLDFIQTNWGYLQHEAGIPVPMQITNMYVNFDLMLNRISETPQIPAGKNETMEDFILTITNDYVRHISRQEPQALDTLPPTIFETIRQTVSTAMNQYVSKPIQTFVDESIGRAVPIVADTLRKTGDNMMQKAGTQLSRSVNEKVAETGRTLMPAVILVGLAFLVLVVYFLMRKK